MESTLAAVIGGMFTLLCVVTANRLKHHDDDVQRRRKDDITLSSINTKVVTVIASQAELWEALEGVRGDVSYIAGSLSVQLPKGR